MNSDNVKILICCHKKTDLPKDNTGILLPIHVGASLSQQNLNIQRDDQINGKSCDNISFKNKSYCELTAMYWAWKNIKKLYPNLKYIGLNHYRRYFDFQRHPFIKNVFLEAENKVLNYHINQNELTKLLSAKNTIISEPRTFAYPIAYNYALQHNYDDLKILAYIISQKYPNYTETMKKYLLQSNRLSPFNMFIMKWEDFEKYCSWLFDCLNELEKVINIADYSSVQKRIYGYMAERLLNIFVQHNKLKVKKLPVIQYVNQKDYSHLFHICRYIRCNISNFFVRTSNAEAVWNQWIDYAKLMLREKEK